MEDAAVSQLTTAWKRTLDHDEQYQSTHNGQFLVFSNIAEPPLPDSRQAIWNEIDEARHEAADALASLKDRIHGEYPEIDLVETSKAARRQYIEFMQDHQRD